MEGLTPLPSSIRVGSILPCRFGRIAPGLALLLALGLTATILIAAVGPARAIPPSGDPASEPGGEVGGDQDEIMAAALRPMKGDLDEMLERRMLRMAIAANPIYFAYDGEKIVGLAVEMAREFEAFLRKTQGVKIDVLLMPFPRDQILAALVQGKADIAVANLTVTAQRQEIVAFSQPVVTKVRELVVTGPAAGEVATFDDLVATGLYLRRSSSYYGHAERLNAERQAAGQAPIPLVAVDERLEDYDLLDLLHAGSIPAMVVDHHKLALWTEVFENIVVHEELVLNEGGEIAWALRQDASQLLDAVNRFIKGVKQGTLIGNVLLQRYLGDAEWIEDIRAGESLAGYEEVAALIKQYATEYGFDWETLVALAYQESRLDQSKRSRSGAVGVMQVMPKTAGDRNVAIADIHELENNIHAGVKYLRFLRDRYFDDPAITRFDQVLFSLAAYNAGPAAIARARKRAEKMGLDPNIWLSNVEVAAARVIGQQPVVYVRNIFKYAISVRLTGGYETVAEVTQVAQVEAVAEEEAEAPGGRPAWQRWAIGILLAITAVALLVYLVRVRQSSPRRQRDDKRASGAISEGRRPERQGAKSPHPHPPGGPYPGRYGPARR